MRGRWDAVGGFDGERWRRWWRRRGRGQAAVRLIEHILINSISPPCNRPHGYLLARAPEKHAMGAIPRERRRHRAYLGDARARQNAREREMDREGGLYVYMRALARLPVRVHKCEPRRCIARGIHARVQERGDPIMSMCARSPRSGPVHEQRGRRFASDVIVSVYTRQSSAD